MEDIIFIGSSFTMGAGLGYPNYINYVEKRDNIQLFISNQHYHSFRKYTFAEMVAKHFNLETNNWGVSGKGLSYVMRRVYQSNKINKKTLFVLEFPPGPRFEIYHPNKKMYIVPSMDNDGKSINYLDDNSNGYKEELNEDTTDLMKLHLLHRNFEYEHTLQTYQFVSMVEFLKKHSNVIVLFGEHPNVDYNTDVIVKNYIENDILKLNGYINFVNWSHEMEKTITADTNGEVEDAHFSYDAHKFIANELIKKIENDYK